MDKRATVMDRGTDKMNETACTREIRIGKQEESERETASNRKDLPTRNLTVYLTLNRNYQISRLSEHHWVSQ